MGVEQDHAYAWSRTRKGGWAIAQSTILGTTITLQRLKKLGYQSLTDVYIELNPSLSEPPNNSLSRPIGKARTYGGVRGALRSFWAAPSTRLAAGFYLHYFTTFGSITFLT